MMLLACCVGTLLGPPNNPSKQRLGTTQRSSPINRLPSSCWWLVTSKLQSNPSSASLKIKLQTIFLEFSTIVDYRYSFIVDQGSYLSFLPLYMCRFGMSWTQLLVSLLSSSLEWPETTALSLLWHGWRYGSMLVIEIDDQIWPLQRQQLQLSRLQGSRSVATMHWMLFQLLVSLRLQLLTVTASTLTHQYLPMNIVTSNLSSWLVLPLVGYNLWVAIES